MPDPFDFLGLGLETKGFDGTTGVDVNGPEIPLR